MDYAMLANIFELCIQIWIFVLPTPDCTLTQAKQLSTRYFRAAGAPLIVF
jgi:hypothetical protein